MRKLPIYATLITTLLLIGFSCKKNNKDTGTSEPTPVVTQPVVATTSFSVDGTSEGSNIILVKGTTSNNDSYLFLLVGSPWTMQVIFSGSNTPVSGTYAIQDSTDHNMPAGKCTIFAGGPDNKFGRPHSGSVTVTTGATNTIEFSNILAPQINLSNQVVATYTLSGVIKY